MDVLSVVAGTAAIIAISAFPLQNHLLWTVLGTKYEQIGSYSTAYEIVKVNPPKHVYVDVKNLDTGTIYRGVYVSKHFNDYREKLRVGRKVVLRRILWEYTDAPLTLRNLFSLTPKVEKQWEWYGVHDSLKK